MAAGDGVLDSEGAMVIVVASADSASSSSLVTEEIIRK